MTDDRLPPLPTLATIAELRRDAETILAHWTGIRDDAQKHMDEAQKILTALSGDRPGRNLIDKRPSVDAQRRVLEFLADRTSPSKTSGIAGALGYSPGYICEILRVHEREGLVTTQRHHHGIRASITTAGIEFLTRPANLTIAS